MIKIQPILFFITVFLLSTVSLLAELPLVVAKGHTGNVTAIRRAAHRLVLDATVAPGETATLQTIGVDTVAENMLRYQRRNGGWPKQFMGKIVDYNKSLSAAELQQLRTGYDKGIDATIDNSATTREIRYLVTSFGKTRDQRYLQSLEKGVGYLLTAQYAHGGWPQFYPDKSGYRSQVTYNDNAMINVLEVLDDIVKKKKGFEVLGDEYRVKSASAISLGIQCILATQVLQKGQLTAWCAQYDAITLQPATARKYELPSVSGSESVGITRFLMSVKNPTRAIQNAITAAVGWLNQVKISGYRFKEIPALQLPKGIDKVLVADTSATTWAKFYHLETNEPFFTGRDGIPRKSIAEVEYERRTGYAWYGDWPLALINREYPAWKATIEKLK